MVREERKSTASGSLPLPAQLHNSDARASLREWVLQLAGRLAVPSPGHLEFYIPGSRQLPLRSESLSVGSKICSHITQVEHNSQYLTVKSFILLSAALVNGNIYITNIILTIQAEPSHHQMPPCLCISLMGLPQQNTMGWAA